MLKSLNFIKISAKNNYISNLLTNFKVLYNNSKKAINTPDLNKLLHNLNCILKDENNNSMSIKYAFCKQINPFLVTYFAKNNLSQSSEKFLKKKITEYFQIQGCRLILKKKD